MSNYFTFMRKELIENLRTKRLLVLGCVFLFFAITSPLLTRYMGEFLAFVMPAGDEMGQALIEVMQDPQWQGPQWFESYAQLYSSLGQIGIWAVLFMYMGTVQREVSTGTASLMFSKGLGFGSFIFAKFTMAVMLTTVITVVSTFVTYGYTFLLFDEAGQIGNILVGSLVFSLGTLMLLSIIILCSSLTKSSAVSGGLSLGAYFVLIISAAIPRIGRFSPQNLFSYPVVISTGHFADEFMVSTLLAAAVAVIALFVATERLKKAEG